VRERTLTVLSACSQVLSLVEAPADSFPAAKVCARLASLYVAAELSVHPQAVVGLFQKLLALENERHENNEQVVAVYYSMVRCFFASHPRPNTLIRQGVMVSIIQSLDVHGLSSEGIPIKLSEKLDEELEEMGRVMKAYGTSCFVEAVGSPTSLTNQGFSYTGTILERSMSLVRHSTFLSLFLTDDSLLHFSPLCPSARNQRSAARVCLRLH
jgi:hypothetical protein